MIRRTLIALAIVTALMGMTPDADAHTPRMRPCPQEDSTRWCAWDAGSFGNGHGHSFWVDAHGGIHYTSRAYVRRLLGY